MCCVISTEVCAKMLPILHQITYIHTDEVPQIFAPKLQSLSLCNLEIGYGSGQELSRTLLWRRDGKADLESLVVRSCHVDSDVNRTRLGKLVKEATWVDTRVVYSDDKSDSDY